MNSQLKQSSFNFSIVTAELYRVSVIPDASGTYNLSVPADRFSDLAGNRNEASNILSWTFDVVSPSVTISPRGSFINGSDTDQEILNFRIQLSQPIAGDLKFPWDKVTTTGSERLSIGPNWEKDRTQESNEFWYDSVYHLPRLQQMPLYL